LDVGGTIIITKNRMCGESVNAVLHDALCGQAEVQVWQPMEAAVGAGLAVTSQVGCFRAAANSRRVCKRRCEARHPRHAPSARRIVSGIRGYNHQRPPTRIGLLAKSLVVVTRQTTNDTCHIACCFLFGCSSHPPFLPNIPSVYL
jgi:hypothetical protein